MNNKKYENDKQYQQECIGFLLKVLEIVLSANQQVVYKLLLTNMDKLDNNFPQLLRNWATTTLSTQTLDKALSTTAAISIFCEIIQGFPGGSIANNQEIAIAGCESVLQFFNSKIIPEQWAVPIAQFRAGTQAILANAYLNRREGERVNNLEQAIAYGEDALKVYSQETVPQQWASTYTTLAIAYSQSLWEDRTHYFERAIICCKKALQVYTREAFPKLWAEAQNNLALVYYQRIYGNPLENVELAITCCKNSLQVHTREDFPKDWAKTTINLATAYRHRLEGKRVDNLQEAITLYQEVLNFIDVEIFPEEWTKAQVNLGAVYQEQAYLYLESEGKESLKEAIEYWIKAVEYFKFESFEESLAIPLPLIRAIASAILTDEDWDISLNDDQLENLDEVINCWEKALQVSKHEFFPEEWAAIYINLGNAYKKRHRIPEAIESFQYVLDFYTPIAFPQECLRIGRILGNLAFIHGFLLEATKAYAAAINALEQLRASVISDSHRKTIVAVFLNLYENMVQACINTGQLNKAIETVERSRSKRLVDLMASNDLYSGGEIPPEVQELLRQYEALQKQIDSERFCNNSDINRGFMETRSSAQDRAAFQAYNEAIDILEKQKDQVFEQIRGLDPVLAGEIQVSAPDFARMQKLIDRPTTAILSFYTTTDNTYIFILRQNQSTPDLHTCEGQGIETLQNWILQNWLQPYYNDKDTWQSQLGDFLAELAQRLQINNLISCYLQGIEELILVPHLLLHQIPLAALPIEDTEHSYLGDKFLIRYVPSCQVLEFCQERENRHPIGGSLNYGIVADATEDLACASFEAEQIAHLFDIPESQHLKGRSQATKSNYRQLASQVQLLHSCHHAESRLDKPLESILKLGDGTLTLGELLTPGWRLPNLSDVFLSCCETNLGVPESLADEILTLSTGFLCAGARSVISTHWSVDDLATALFSIFYYQHRKEGKSRPEALQQAQKKLRSLTQEDIKSLSQKVQTKRQEARKQRKQHPPGSADYLKWDGEYRKYAGVTVKIDKVKTYSNDEPYSHPRYWAAFTCSGLR
ncbi:CHAT domain-containing protein [Floridanema aerugineum]|uniref:CHAT domain-containing protein n=1 Tax=Floridaenema aerugineum BLCC-F46 TaxID=3153654 RepID=A0ABV4X066_9CYAN